MRIIKGKERGELYVTSLEAEIGQYDEVRAYDYIVDLVDIDEMKFRGERKSKAGRPVYSARTLIKLYMYGYRLGIRSGRKLEDTCKYDTRFRWLLKGQTPDANTINDFRKNNKEELKKCFYEINKLYKTMGLLNIKDVSQDGYKISASNSKDNNYTKNKVVDRIKYEVEKLERKEEKMKKIEGELTREKNAFDKYIKCLEKSEEIEELTKEAEEKKKELDKYEEELKKARKEIEGIEGKKNATRE